MNSFCQNSEAMTSANNIRAERAQRALIVYAGFRLACGGPTERRNAFVDLVTDLAHYADLMGFDVLDLIQKGVGAWSAERRSDEGYPSVNDAVNITIVRKEASDFKEK